MRTIASFAFVGSVPGRRPTTFGERSEFVPLDRFDADDSRLVLTRPAEELGVHRNTVRNRLATAERLLGRPLDDAATRMDVWAALQAPPAG